MTTTLCENLGDAPAPARVDQDVWTFQGHVNETVTVQLDATQAGGRADLILVDEQGTAVDVFQLDRSTLPNQVTATLPVAGAYRIAVQEQPSSLILTDSPFRGDYCITFQADLGAAASLTPTSSVESSAVSGPGRVPPRASKHPTPNSKSTKKYSKRARS